MKPLIVLLSIFALCLLTTKVFYGNYEFALSGRIAMSVMLLFTAAAHFAFNKGMAMMLPAFVPYKIQIVYLTGIIEIIGALGLFFPGIRILTGWLLIVFFILIVPANIYAAVHHIDYQKGNSDGNGLPYLWFRIPLQVLFILWVYFSTVKH